LSERHFEVRGTPVDCIIMGVRHLLVPPPDLILSGINRGQNLAEDVRYSGTIGAAMEATIMGIPAIAVSQSYGVRGRAHVQWQCAETHALPVIKKLLAFGVPKNTLFNINFPDCSPAEVKGVAVVRQGRHDEDMVAVEKRIDGRETPYYWMLFNRQKRQADKDTDLGAILDNFITVTPVQLDTTNREALVQLKQVFAS
jgi:5'-nucleotidase